MTVKTNKLRIAVIGVGYFGYFHAKKLAALDNVELAAVVDIRPDRAKEVADELGVRSALSHQEILADIDAATIAAPSEIHARIARDLLLADKDVLCEKPLALTMEDANDLAALAAERGRILQVGHLERFNPAVEELIKRVDNPGFIEAERIAPIKRRSLDIDVVLDLMIHDIDVILALTGEKPAEIRAVGAPVVGQYPDIVNARLEFPGGCVANLTASRLALKEERKMRVFQPDCYLALDFRKCELAVVNNVTFKDGGQPIIDFERPALRRVDPLEEELRSFADCALERVRPRVDGEEARAVMECVLDIRGKIEENLVGRKKLLLGPGHWVGLEG